jgi:hypothetical protein
MSQKKKRLVTHNAAAQTVHKSIAEIASKATYAITILKIATPTTT